MKKRFTCIASLLLATSLVSAEPVDGRYIRILDAFDSGTSIQLSDNNFKDLITDNLVRQVNLALEQRSDVEIFNQKKEWIDLDEVESSSQSRLVRFGMSTSKFAKGTLIIEGANNSSLYLNGTQIKGNNKFKLELVNGDYRVLLLVEGVKDWKQFKVDWNPDNKDSKLIFNRDSEKTRVSMQQFFDAESVMALNLSPDGKRVLWSKAKYSEETKDKREVVSEIYDLDKRQLVYRWQGSVPSSARWSPDGQFLAFVDKDAIYSLSVETLLLKEIATGLKDIRAVEWNDNKSLLLSWQKPEKKPHEFTKRYRALEDRWSYWRGNSQIYLMDVESGYVKQVTNNRLSTALLDHEQEKGKLLVSREPVDYKKAPHQLTQLLELDIETGKESQLGEFRTFNNARYHSMGIIFSAGPDLLANESNGLGSALENGKTANNYDGQLYLRNSKGEIEALSKNFDPSIGQFEVLKNGDLLLLAGVQDKKQLYLYSFSSKKFKKIKTQVEVVESFSVSNESRATIVYKGSSATAPQKMMLYRVGKSKQRTLFDSAKTEFANNKFPHLKDWDYTTKSGNKIDGRIYLPTTFEENKKYPAIVYYYGGTSPVSRSFTGRWPFSLWANHGYVVYVLQPSGTTGYGQDFSAKHVNAWGKQTANDIIESTNAFLAAHQFVDEKRVGNMGASYGGFMTMYLATKTDIFSASISHAGISNLTSYWGYGWWGYAYSGVASKNSFPWNNAELYTEQSPVFNADKVTTPLLLLHGDADTNVPVGESHQMYTALKLLEKDVELIEFQGDDHHINKRSHRIRWWKSILAYFDFKLKQEPDWWYSLYPEK
ncbi:S9 family peptidase [Aliikangiella sp. G2MR2-5]|uniref:alpha/beta hydrolase family protein n=1 Tax=Aliikangiella sp. G2MR2-5 TaxID=2788943 RepID=UPI0018AC5D85|nr:S9 family peptidase [Aliikangiella sp. G2MR2-5]